MSPNPFTAQRVAGVLDKYVASLRDALGDLASPETEIEAFRAAEKVGVLVIASTGGGNVQLAGNIAPAVAVQILAQAMAGQIQALEQELAKRRPLG